METSQLICTANQLTGFYMRATLTFNGLTLDFPLDEKKDGSNIKPKKQPEGSHGSYLPQDIMAIMIKATELCQLMIFLANLNKLKTAL